MVVANLAVPSPQFIQSLLGKVILGVDIQGVVEVRQSFCLAVLRGLQLAVLNVIETNCCRASSRAVRYSTFRRQMGRFIEGVKGLLSMPGVLQL